MAENPTERKLAQELGQEPILKGFSGANSSSDSFIDEETSSVKVKPKESIKLTEPEDSFVPLKPETGKPFKMFPQGPLTQGGGLTPGSLEHLLNIIRPYASGAIGGVAGTAVGGPLGIPAGIAAYTAADIGQKVLTGGLPEATGEELSDSVKEGLINEVGGRIFQGIGAGVKALRNVNVPDPNSILKLYPKTSSTLENYGWHKLARLTKFSEDFGAPAASAAALDRAGGEGFTQALLLSNRMNSGGRFTKNVFQDPKVLHKKILDTLEQGITKNPTPGQFQSNLHYASQEAHDLLNSATSPFDALDDVLNNKNKLEKVLTVGQAVGPKNLNVRKDLQAYYWNRIFDEATTFSAPGKARIDPDKINNLWFNPKTQLRENLETLYGKQGKQDLDQFMKNIIDTQSGSMAGSIPSKIKYFGGGFALSGLLSHLNPVAGSMIGTGLYLSNAAMGRLLTNPSTAKAVLSLTNAGPQAMGQKLIARGIFNALEGTRIAILGPNGEKNWGGIARSPDGSVDFIPEK